MNKSQETKKNCPVPFEQQPLTEYERLKERPGFAWTSKSQGEYLKFVAALFFGFMAFCLFIGTASMQTSNEVFSLTLLSYCIVGATTLQLLVFLRVYLGWQYVYSRLMQSTVPYEESGWYDGQIWVKSPETLVQDRLTGTYQLEPVLQRLKVGIFSLISFQFLLMFWILR